MNAQLTKYLGIFVSVLIMACSSEKGSDDSSGNDSEVLVPDDPVPGVDSDCGSVRMTQYDSSDRRWCGFDRTSDVLPDFVRAGMTVAIAEPYNGSSYKGDAGEACGECWEISTSFATQIVMVHDLCPIEGNPICGGSHFHFDVSQETAAVIDGGAWLGEAAAQRVPCPVTGNVHIYIKARNQYGYLQLAFFNHRFPIRTVEYRAANGTQWMPLERCLARWCLDGDMQTFAADGPGGVFRLISATGEVVEGSDPLTYATGEGADFDMGVQFASAESSGRTCEFTPPGHVYDDGWGGIEGVRWDPNTWGSTSLSEIGEGCANDSASCLLLRNFADSGLHVTYRHVFSKNTFSTLVVSLRASSGAGTVEVAPRSTDARCAFPTTAQVDEHWSTVEINVVQSCPDTEEIHGLTISRPSGPMDIVVDDIRYQN